MRPVEAVHAESKCLRVLQALFALKNPARSTCGSEEAAWAPLNSSRTARRRQHGQRRLRGSGRPLVKWVRFSYYFPTGKGPFSDNLLRRKKSFLELWSWAWLL